MTLTSELPADIDTRLRAAAADRPEARAVQDGARTLTWSALDRSVNRVANALRARGLEPGDRVAILGRNSVAYIEVLLGCLRAGGCATPLSGLSSEDALIGMLNDSGARFLFMDADAAPSLNARLAELPSGSRVEVIALGDGGALTSIPEFLGEAPEAAPALVPDPAWPFNLIYSSGTTGSPKGIIQDRAFRAREAADMASAFALDAQTRTLVSTPLYSNTTLFLLFSTLAAGGSAVLMEKFEPRSFLRLCETEAVTHAVLVPVQYGRLLATPDFDTYDLSAFRAKFCTSAPLQDVMKRDVLRRWPAGGLIEFYGMTEGGVNCTLFAHERPDKLDTVGLPAPDCDLRIIDEAGQELPSGVVGEVVGHGPKMMAGYHNREDATHEASWRDDRGRRFHRSGDLGWLDDEGFLHLVDRKKDMIISGGFNIYASDLEGVLLRHDSIAEAAVVGAPSEHWGETPVAFVVAAGGQGCDAEVLRAWANAQLGKAQRISEVRLVPHLPRSPIGKVLKRELRDAFAAVSR